MYCEEDFCLSKKFYKELYSLMTDVNDILVDNDIHYWGVSGTTLGALRHKGIISWDDDIDITVWHKDWLRLLTSKIKKQFRDIGCVVTKESGLNLIKIFYEDAEYTKKNYKLPFIDVFSASLDKKRRGKIVYTHKWAREGWPKDHLYIDELYPLRYAKFGGTHVLVPNDSEKYMCRMFGSDWNKKGLIYQSHLLRIELEDPIVVTGPFKPAKDFDNKKIIRYRTNEIANPPEFIMKKL